MPHSGVSDVDECAVVRFEGNSNVLFQDASEQVAIPFLHRVLSTRSDKVKPRQGECRGFELAGDSFLGG